MAGVWGMAIEPQSTADSRKARVLSDVRAELEKPASGLVQARADRAVEPQIRILPSGALLRRGASLHPLDGGSNPNLRIEADAKRPTTFVESPR
jgi:hypothetical protein